MHQVCVLCRRCDFPLVGSSDCLPPNLRIPVLVFLRPPICLLGRGGGGNEDFFFSRVCCRFKMQSDAPPPPPNILRPPRTQLVQVAFAHCVLSWIKFPSPTFVAIASYRILLPRSYIELLHLVRGGFRVHVPSFFFVEDGRDT